jgi:hypothetical protein
MKAVVVPCNGLMALAPLPSFASPDAGSAGRWPIVAQALYGKFAVYVILADAGFGIIRIYRTITVMPAQIPINQGRQPGLVRVTHPAIVCKEKADGRYEWSR